MERELKPCPFCGSEAEASTTDIIVYKIHSVECSNEDCGGRMSKGRDFNSLEEAITAWNHRSQDQRIEVLTKALENIMSELKGYSDNTFGRNAYKIAEKALSGGKQ
jgi:Lar family restriction alleviation protein